MIVGTTKVFDRTTHVQPCPTNSTLQTSVQSTPTDPRAGGRADGWECSSYPRWLSSSISSHRICSGRLLSFKIRFPQTTPYPGKEIILAIQIPQFLALAASSDSNYHGWTDRRQGLAAVDTAIPGLLSSATGYPAPENPPPSNSVVSLRRKGPQKDASLYVKILALL